MKQLTFTKREEIEVSAQIKICEEKIKHLKLADKRIIGNKILDAIKR